MEKKTRVLMLNDTGYMGEMIKDIMRKYGYEVINEAENGRDIVEKYFSLKPDLVTINIPMPQISEIDTVKNIIKMDPDASILVISAPGQQGLIVDAIQAGAKGFVIKPFKPEALIEEIKRIVK